MMNYKFQKVILVARKILSAGVTLSAPLLLKIASDYATIERGYSGSLGGELFIPIALVLLGYLIYPKYDVILVEDENNENDYSKYDYDEYDDNDFDYDDDLIFIAKYKKLNQLHSKYTRRS